MTKPTRRDRLRTISLTVVVAPVAICASGVTNQGSVFVLLDEVTARQQVTVPIVRRRLELDGVKQKPKKPVK